MKIRLLFTIIFTIFTFQFVNAQTQSGRVPTTEVIRLVSDAFSKHNVIYNERI